MFRRSDLDAFLAGGRRDSVLSGRPGTPPMEDADGQNESQLEVSMEALGQADAPARGLEDERRRSHRPAKGHRPDHGAPAGTEEGVPPGQRPRRLQLVGGGETQGQRRLAPGEATERALRRLRGLSV